MEYFDVDSYLNSNTANAVQIGIFENGKDQIINAGAINEKSVFDIASLTKIFLTTFAFMQFREEKILSVDDAIGKYLPTLKTEFQSITIAQLLSHTSGLPAWRPLYALIKKRSQLIEYLNTLDFEAKPGSKRIYSDLGFMLLGLIIEKVSGLDLEKYFNKFISEKYKLQNTSFQKTIIKENCIETSLGNPYEQTLSKKYHVDYSDWRNYRLKGECNDFNCFKVFNGVAGHCGLFSNVQDLLILSKEFINFSSLSEFAVKKYCDNGLGFAHSDDVLQFKFSENTFGHHGFTGCSFFMDFSVNKILVLLSNRQFGSLPGNDGYIAWKSFFN